MKLVDIEPQHLINLQTELWEQGEGYDSQAINNIVSLASAILK